MASPTAAASSSSLTGRRTHAGAGSAPAPRSRHRGTTSRGNRRSCSGRIAPNRRSGTIPSRRSFAQSIVETGWFRYGGSVQCDQNNYGGFLGKSFPDAETGVRAQIQHLRAYADPSATSCSQPPLATPCADPVFNSVNPKGKAPNWNDMGNGNWAAAPDYADKVLTVYNQMRASAGLPGV